MQRGGILYYDHRASRCCLLQCISSTLIVHPANIDGRKRYVLKRYFFDTILVVNGPGFSAGTSFTGTPG